MNYQYGCGGVGQRSVNNVGVSGDPADVGGAPVNFARVVVEDVFKSRRRVHEVPGCRVLHALGLAG